MISITKRFCFESAHFLPGHEGKCQGIHGHSYKLYISIAGLQIVGGSSDGMVMDFKDLKEIMKPKIDEWDHALIVKDEDTLPASRDRMRHDGHKIVSLGVNPTAENMCKVLVEFIRDNLPNSVKLTRVQLWETEDSYAEWQL